MDDIHLARKYLQKAKNAHDRKISFDLSFMAYKNLMKAKRCHAANAFKAVLERPNHIDIKAAKKIIKVMEKK